MSSTWKGRGSDRAPSTSDSALRTLREECRKGAPPSLIIACGDDEFRRSEIARRLPQWIVPEEERDLCLTLLTGREAGPKEILDALATEALPFFGSGHRVVLVRDCTLLGSKTDAAGTALAARIDAGLPSDVTLILEATAVDKRTRLAQVCMAKGRVLEFAQATREAETAEFVGERFRLAGVRADRAAVTALLALLPSDSGILSSEVRKLTTYVGERKHVTVEDVAAIITRSRETVVFELTDRLGQRDVAGALAALRDLIHQGQSGIGIVMLVAARLRLLLVARALLDAGEIPASLCRADRYDSRFKAEWDSLGERIKSRMPEDRAANLTQQHPFVVYKVLGEAARVSTEELRRGLARAAEADVALKSTTGIDEASLLTHFVLSLCQPESLLTPVA
jgi:DNA polymerase III subunit delta